jgi:transcriptional regulator with XRE-family HTH domain
MIDLVRVGAKIALLRNKKGLSQDALAEKLYLSRQAISAWEVGKSAPTIDNVIELSKLFDVPFDEILCLGENDQINPQNPYEGHNHDYILRSVIDGKIQVDYRSLFYNSTGNERMVLLAAVKSGRLLVPEKTLYPLLNQDEKEYLGKGVIKQ